MPNSWKILDGLNYIAKASSGAVAGAAGTMEAPRTLTTTSFVVGKNVIGAGSYVWPAGFYLPTGCNIIADGHVRLLGDTATSQQAFNTNCGVDGIYFDQWAGISFCNGGSAVPSFKNCVFNLLTYAPNNTLYTSYAVGQGIFSNCVFINVGTAAWLGTQDRGLYNCLLFSSVINTALTSNGNITNSYLDPTSGIICGGSGFGIATNCNVDPATVIGTNRGIKIGTGGAWGNGQSQAGCVNCITQAPQFNSLTNGDFTIKLTSPHIAPGIGPAQYPASIAFNVAYTGGGADVSSANTGINSALGGAAVPILSLAGDPLQVNAAGGLIVKPITGGTYVSTVTTGVLTLDAVGPKEMTRIELVAGLNFNSDFQASDPFVPVLQNNNVADYNNGGVGTAESRPNRLTYRMRWSVLANPNPATASHWVSGLTWVEMEYFTKPTYNLSGYAGNGVTGFIPANALPVLCRTFQLEITTRNNYA